MEAVYTTRTTCRLCGGSFELILSLGDIALNDFVDKDQASVFVPLTLVKCTQCDLVQLQDTANLDLLYRQYWYQSGLNKSMVADLQDVVNHIEDTITLQPGDTVVDIGCNDLYTGDVVRVDGYNDDFKVTTYENDMPKYIPFI